MGFLMVQINCLDVTSEHTLCDDLAFYINRNDKEKKIWKLEDTSDEWKIKNLEIMKKRLSGWQLESFNESYKHKINNGVSLFKKNLNKD